MKKEKNIKKTIVALLALLAHTNSFAASCVQNYEERINDLDGTQAIFMPDKGSNGLEALGQALGATALGVTAGGVIGFVLPYALIGVSAATMAAPGAIGMGTLLGFAGAENDQFDVGFSLNSAVPAALFSWLIIDLAMTGLRPAKAIPTVASALSGAAIPYFVPITALVGGVAGLTLGTHDAIVNYKIKKLYDVKEFIEVAHSAADEGNLKYLFAKKYAKLGKKLNKRLNADDAAKIIAKADQEQLFCKNDKLFNMKKIKNFLMYEADRNSVSGDNTSMTNVIEPTVSVNDLELVAQKIKDLNLTQSQKLKATDVVLQIPIEESI